MECYVRKKRRGKTAIFILAAIFIFAFLGIAYTNKKLDALVCDAAIPQIRNALSEMINDAVEKVISSSDAEYLSVKTDSGGRTLSIAANTKEINILAAAISSEIAARLAELDEFYVHISLSNIYDDEIIFGRFPNLSIPANVTPNGSIERSVQSTIESAGINQSLYKIELSVSLKVTAMMLISTVDVETYTNVCIAQALIVGDVPSVYAGDL